MRRIFITGSSEGLGFLTSKLLLEQGRCRPSCKERFVASL
jgi:NAD(P)-dependent dehydrogenase (short-subunit alcohol dehydrogenase family)